MESVLHAKAETSIIKPRTRVIYIDNLKVFLTCLVVAHHAAQAYGPTGGVWVVNDPLKALWLKDFFFINASFMMGLYFFISGYFMPFSVNRKSNQQFTRDRLTRLGIPLLFFTLFVFFPFNYFTAETNKNPFAFLVDSYFNKPPMATGHLWFVASLLVYSFLYLLLFKNRLQLFEKREHSFQPSYIIVFVLALTIISGIVRLSYPIDEWRTWLIPVEIAHIPQYLSLFLIGTVFNHGSWLKQLTPKIGLLSFSVAVTGFIFRGMLPVNIRSYWLVEPFIESLLCVGIILGLLGFFKKYANKSNKAMQYLSHNAYGIYLVHLFVVIGFQSLMLEWEFSPNGKFVLVTILSLLCSLLITSLLRKIKVLNQII